MAPLAKAATLDRISSILANRMLDQDGDSQMHASSPSSQEDDSDNMFPTASDAPTSQQTSRKEIGRDLSPPRSQDCNQTDGDEAMDLSGDPKSTSEEIADGDGITRHPMKGGGSSYEPGSRWNNPKAKEEAQRAWSQLLDKKFSLSKLREAYPGEINIDNLVHRTIW